MPIRSATPYGPSRASSSEPVKSSEDASRPDVRSAAFANVPAGAPESRCSASSTCRMQNRSERGKLPLSTRNASTSVGSNDCWRARAYGSLAQHASSTSCHTSGPASGSTPRSTRAVIAARSRYRPMRRNIQASSCASVASQIPPNACALSRIARRNDEAPSGPTLRADEASTNRYSALMHSQISVVSSARTLIALRRAMRTQAAIDSGVSPSKTIRSIAPSRSAPSSGYGSMPAIA